MFLVFELHAADVNVLKHQVGVERGIVLIVGDNGGALAQQLSAHNELLYYVQLQTQRDVRNAREMLLKEGLLNRRIFVDAGPYARLHLADNLADAVIVVNAPAAALRQEALRVVRPGGKVIVGDTVTVKPVPDGHDDWTHPAHGPDNNPLSRDTSARYPYRTQYIGDPKFCPIPQVTVACHGRIFRAFGGFTNHYSQKDLINTLLCVNAYNGTILWQRPLKEGFRVHRQFMIATPEILYLADNEACMLIDAATGLKEGELTVPKSIPGDYTFKWIGLENDRLVALIGDREQPIRPWESRNRTLGHWSWDAMTRHLGRGRRPYFGHTLLAFDTPNEHRILWSTRETDLVDSRAICMTGDRIYYYSPQKHLVCMDTRTGKAEWKVDDQELLKRVGKDSRAWSPPTGFGSSSYLKCNEDYLFFAGPQRPHLVAISARNGKMLWHKQRGNYQLVLCDDALYAAGEGRRPSEQEPTTLKLDYETGEVLKKYLGRKNCARATGTIDSLFFRAWQGTIRIDRESGSITHITPMRPPCNDGVIVSNGLLFWGPWQCGACNLSLFGHICLSPVSSIHARRRQPVRARIEYATDSPEKVQPLRADRLDAFCCNNERALLVVTNDLSRTVEQKWKRPSATPSAKYTTPVLGGHLMFLGDSGGVVHGIDHETGRTAWRSYAGGGIHSPPTLWKDRLYVGSADGWLYVLEAVSGRLLWRFHPGPRQRKIPVFGKIISSWPVMGGAVVRDGVAYVAAGMTHYDGTFVHALDAATGKLKWSNVTSGTVTAKYGSGVSVQGALSIEDDRLCFNGGNVYPRAMYDLQTGASLNKPETRVTSRQQTLFSSYYPEYNQCQRLNHSLGNNKVLSYDTNISEGEHAPLALLEGDSKQFTKDGWRFRLRRNSTGIRRAWVDNTLVSHHAFALGAKHLLSAGVDKQGASHLKSIDISNGRSTWQQTLPSAAIRKGLIITPQGNIIVVLKNGEIVCFGE